MSDSSRMMSALIAATVQKGISGGVATKADIIRLESDMRVGFAKIESDVKWIKLIGGVIVAALVLTLFADPPAGSVLF